MFFDVMINTMIENLNYKKILKQALRNGGEIAELFEEQSYVTAITRSMKRFERAHQGIDAGVGLRLMANGKTFYAFTNQIQETSLLDLANRISSAVSAARWDQDIKLLTPTPKWKKQIKEDPTGIPFERKAKLVELADSAAWNEGSKICQVNSNYLDKIRDITLINSEGRFVQERQIYTVFFVTAAASDGQILQTGYEPIGGTMGFELFSQNNPEQVARVAADRALRMLQASPAPKGKMMVVISSEAGGTMIHEAVGHGLEADLAKEGLSVYENRVGKQVAASLISVIDDSTLQDKRGSFLFDDEGTPGQRNVLIENGILKSYMYDRRYADREQMTSTGNSRRQSYQYRPIVRMTNTFVAPGKHNPEDIIKSVDHGIFVKKMGGGQVNTVNGEFVFDCTESFLIENGKLGPAVRGATLVGSGMDVLKSVDMVGNDLGFSLGTCGKCGQGVPVGDAQPTMRIPEMTVGGMK